RRVIVFALTDLDASRGRPAFVFSRKWFGQRPVAVRRGKGRRELPRPAKGKRDHNAVRCEATALHFPFCLTKVSVKIIEAARAVPSKVPTCAARPVTTAASP